MGGKKVCAKPLQCASLRYYMQFSIHFYPFTSIAGESLRRTSTGGKKEKRKNCFCHQKYKNFSSFFQAPLQKSDQKPFLLSPVLSSKLISFFLSFSYKWVLSTWTRFPENEKKDLKLILFLQKRSSFQRRESRIPELIKLPTALSPNSTSNILIKEREKPPLRLELIS